MYDGVQPTRSDYIHVPIVINPLSTQGICIVIFRARTFVSVAINVQLVTDHFFKLVTYNPTSKACINLKNSKIFLSVKQSYYFEIVRYFSSQSDRRPGATLNNEITTENLQMLSMLLTNAPVDSKHSIKFLTGESYEHPGWSIVAYLMLFKEFEAAQG